MVLPVFVDPRDHDAVLIELDSLITGAGSLRPYHRAREFVRVIVNTCGLVFFRRPPFRSGWPGCRPVRVG